MSKLIVSSRRLPALILTLSLYCGVAHADNLLTNGDFSMGNTNFSSGYTFVPAGQGTEVGTGTYGIRTNSLDFDTGYSYFDDHTSGTGYMMLLDGSPSGAVGWSSSVSVQTNQSYLLSAWLASSDAANPPVIRFAINGTPVGSDYALSNVGGQWQNFLANWNSTTNTNATITLVDEVTIGYGNDFALDDLYFGPSLSATNGPVTLNIYPAIEINWNSQSNFSYQVQYSTALNTNAWVNFGNPIPGNGGSESAFDSTHGQPQRFYRVETLP